MKFKFTGIPTPKLTNPVPRGNEIAITQGHKGLTFEVKSTYSTTYSFELTLGGKAQENILRLSNHFQETSFFTRQLILLDVYGYTIENLGGYCLSHPKRIPEIVRVLTFTIAELILLNGKLMGNPVTGGPEGIEIRSIVGSAYTTEVQRCLGLLCRGDDSIPYEIRMLFWGLIGPTLLTKRNDEQFLPFLDIAASLLGAFTETIFSLHATEKITLGDERPEELELRKIIENLVKGIEKVAERNQRSVN